MARGSSGRFWGFIALLVFLHLALHVAFGMEGGAPDLMVVAALFAARRLKGSRAALLGLVLGVLDDAFALIAFGASAVALSIVSYLGARSRDLFEGDSILFVGVFLFLGKLLRDVLQLLVSQGGIDWVEFTAFPVAALYAAGAGMVALVLYRAIADDR